MSTVQPPEVLLGDGATRVLLAVLAGNYLTEDLMAATGRARSTVWKHLHRLRDLGLVSFTDDQAGTLHPLVRLVG